MPTPAVFRDDLESSLFTKWTGTTISIGCTLIVQKVWVHHGGYAATATTAGAAAAEAARGNITLDTSLAELYARLYVRVLSHDITVANDRFMLIRFTAVQNCAWAGIRYNAGTTTPTWYIQGRNGAGYADAYTTDTPILNKWYCVEMYWRLNATTGQLYLWIDGKRALSVGPVDTDDYGNVSSLSFGIAETANTVAADIRFDCCVVDTQYIGPERPLRALHGRWGDRAGKQHCRIYSTRRGNWGGIDSLK